MITLEDLDKIAEEINWYENFMTLSDHLFFVEEMNAYLERIDANG